MLWLFVEYAAGDAFLRLVWGGAENPQMSQRRLFCVVVEIGRLALPFQQHRSWRPPTSHCKMPRRRIYWEFSDFPYHQVGNASITAHR